jgi:hypothetical protein
MKTKTKVLAVCLTLTILSAGSVYAGGRNGGNRGPRGGGNEQHKAKMLEKFDADGDGVLSDAEKTTAKANRPERKEGKSQKSEFWKKMMLQKYDANGDGVLSESEEETAIAAGN